MFLSESQKKELRGQLKYFGNLARKFDGRTTVAERIAINNLRMTICDLLCIEAKQNGQYMNDLGGTPRTAYNFSKGA